MLLQVGGAVPRSSLELLQQSSGETKVVLAITALFSIVSWFIIVLKWWQFRRIRRQADRFFTELERTTRLQEAYTILMKQPPSPYNRLFREGMNFYNELRPGALREDASATRTSLTMTQLEALKMVLGKEISAERELADPPRALARHDRRGRAAPRPPRHGARRSWTPSSASRPRGRATSPPWPRAWPRRSSPPWRASPPPSRP